MKCLSRLFNHIAYDQGYAEGYEDGVEDGHTHGACQHTHPFDVARRLFGFSTVTGRINVRGPELQNIPYDRKKGY